MKTFEKNLQDLTPKIINATMNVFLGIANSP